MKIPILFPALAIALFSCNHERKAVSEAATPIEEPPPTQAALIIADTGGPTNADSLFFSLERTPCFGSCKAYRIAVYRSGFATYNGRSNMEKEGPHTTRIGQETMALLLAKAEEMGFFTMQDKYDAEVTDLPSTFIRVVANGKDKMVMGRVGQPAAFKSLAAYAEEQLLPLPWKPTVAEP